VVHVIRCFEDADVQHVMGPVDPARDREVINIELQLADLASVEKRLDKAVRTAKSGDAQARLEADAATHPEIRQLLDFARRRGDHTVMLLSNHRLTAALRIYERLGFVRRPFPEPPAYADADVYMEIAV